MDEFAALIGISRPTISKYFNDPESVRATTRARIEDALKLHRFRPNIYAMYQNRHSAKTIGIVVPYLADPFFAEIARNIERRCMEKGYWPILFSSHGSRAYQSEILSTLRSLKPAGVLLAPLGAASDNKEIAEFCSDVPTVLFDANIEGVGSAFIGSDNFHSLPLMIDYLCRTGTAPCFFEMAPLNPNATDRRLAYVSKMEALGLEPQVVRVGGENWDFEQIGLNGGLEVFGKGGFPSNTILCSNDRLAIGLIAAAYKMGITVGRERNRFVRIAGHDDHPFSRFTSPPLTTIAQDYSSISARSVETLFGLIDGDSKPVEREDFLYQGKLMIRESA